MKITILSASTGGGHMSAANAIKSYLVSLGISAEVFDALEYISPILNKTVTEIYEYIATKQPKIWKMVYKSSNKKSVNKLVGGINSLISKKLLPLIQTFDPDLIISTHPFTTEMISNLKMNNTIEIPLICVMTDYAPHRTWTSSGVDAYVVANSGMVESMKDMGVNPESIYPFGIPVEDSFHVKSDKNKILQELSLDPSLPTILIMAGKSGFASIDKIYDELQKIDIKIQIIVITGKNKKLYDKIKSISEGNPLPRGKRAKILAKISKYLPKLKHIRFRVKFKKASQIKCTQKTKMIYYTDQVEKYMYASDLIITKPGGLTVSEALACGLPMALFGAIPGQEEENSNFLVNHNMAVKLENNISETIKNLLQDPLKLGYMKDSCEKFDKSDSLKNILNLIYKLTAKEKTFNKLVRDKIPEIIQNQGNVPTFRILDQNSYIKYLDLKLSEECKEVEEAITTDSKTEELADVLEVIKSIAMAIDVPFEKVEEECEIKRKKRGGFEKRIFLEKVLFPSEIN